MKICLGDGVTFVSRSGKQRAREAREKEKGRERAREARRLGESDGAAPAREWFLCPVRGADQPGLLPSSSLCVLRSALRGLPEYCIPSFIQHCFLEGGMGRGGLGLVKKRARLFIYR